MTLTERLEELVLAAFTGIWVQTHEPEDALLEIHELAQRHGWRLASWDIDQGFRLAGNGDGEAPAPRRTTPCRRSRPCDPRGTRERGRHPGPPELPPVPGQRQVVQALHNEVVRGKVDSRYFVILSPVVQIPSNWNTTSSSSNTTSPGGTNWNRSPGASPPGTGTCRTARPWGGSSMPPRG